LCSKFIKLILPLPSFFKIALPSEEEPNIFHVDIAPQSITCPNVLDRFHLIQFFTDAQQRRRRYLGEAKKQHKSRFIDRCLPRKPDELTEEERGFVREWLREDFHTKHIYQALNNMRYVLKATTDTQATKRLKDWLKLTQVL